MPEQTAQRITSRRRPPREPSRAERRRSRSGPPAFIGQGRPLLETSSAPPTDSSAACPLTRSGCEARGAQHGGRRRDSSAMGNGGRGGGGRGAAGRRDRAAGGVPSSSSPRVAPARPSTTTRIQTNSDSPAQPSPIQTSPPSLVNWVELRVSALPGAHYPALSLLNAPPFPPAPFSDARRQGASLCRARGRKALHYRCIWVRPRKAPFPSVLHQEVRRGLHQQGGGLSGWLRPTRRQCHHACGAGRAFERGSGRRRGR